MAVPQANHTRTAVHRIQRPTPRFAPGPFCFKSVLRQIRVAPSPFARVPPDRGLLTRANNGWWLDVDSISQRAAAFRWLYSNACLVSFILPRDRCRFGNETRCLQARLNATIHPRRYMRADSLASATGNTSRQTDRKSVSLQWTGPVCRAFSLSLCLPRNGSNPAAHARAAFLFRAVAQGSQLASVTIGMVQRAAFVASSSLR